MTSRIFITIFTLSLLFFMLFAINPILATSDESNFYTGVVVKIIESEEKNSNSQKLNSQTLEIELKDSSKIKVKTIDDPTKYKLDDKVTLQKMEDQFGAEQYFVTGFSRSESIFQLFALFFIVVVIISRLAGIASILGMAYSFFILFKFLLPKLYLGQDPLLITLATILLIAPVSFTLSHGLNKKTFVALISTFVSLTITFFTGMYFLDNAHLNGTGSEEAIFLQLIQGEINLRGLLLAGIVIGTLGILDDATVTQTSIVAQIKADSKNLLQSQVFSKAMKIGHDHIASTVNTLVLVYTGAALPLLLLFTNSNKTFIEVLNGQIIAEEIITMLVSSIGLVISIPISTFLASLLISNEDHSTDHFGHSH